MPEISTSMLYDLVKETKNNISSVEDKIDRSLTAQARFEELIKSCFKRISNNKEYIDEIKKNYQDSDVWIRSKFEEVDRQISDLENGIKEFKTVVKILIALTTPIYTGLVALIFSLITGKLKIIQTAIDLTGQSIIALIK